MTMNEGKKYNEIFKTIRQMESALMDVMYARDIPMAVARLVFLKYALDNYVGASTTEDMRNCAEAQRILGLRDVEKGFESVKTVMRYIDKAYKLDQILSSEENLEKYKEALFGTDFVSKKRNVTEESYKNVISILLQLDLKEEYIKATLGEMLVDALIHSIMDDSSRNAYRGEITTGEKLNQIVRDILEVNTNDVFCDFTAGIGVSTISITNKTKPIVMLADEDPNSTSLCAMFLIMSGYLGFTVQCRDTLRNTAHDIHGNKMFVDPPVGLRMMKELHDSTYNDATLIAIEKIIKNHLDDDGVAVIAVPGKVLFGSGPAKNLRSELIGSGCIKAVIALPPLWTGINIGTNLLVIEKKDHHEVTLIDASGSRRDLSPDKSRLIVDVINDPREEEDFSAVASDNEIILRGYDLVPANYVKTTSTPPIESVEDIDSELEQLYKQLFREVM